MSACMFIASDAPLPEFAPPQDHPVRIDLDSGTTDDGGADDNYVLTTFRDVKDYTDKEYGVTLEWNFTDGRANQLIDYIRSALQKADSVEVRHVWLTDYFEFEERPFLHRTTLSVNELTPAHLKQIDNAVIWNTPDKQYPQRPSFYCLTITQ